MMRRVAVVCRRSPREALCCSAAAYHMPGWKTSSSTKDARSREQREADRKARQIEKLPRPEALHDFQYPYEKTVLADSMFEFPVFENELDTPYLYNPTPPPDFFLYWNVADFERTAYPAVPKEDHRLLFPSAKNAQWVAHRERLMKYLRKHEILPHYVSNVHADVNLSVVFSGRYMTRARLTDENGDPLPPAPPVTALNRQNFWFTAHCGNYMELSDLQQPPQIFFLEDTEGDPKKETFYTLVMLSPDYPYRVPIEEDRLHADRGFFLNYMVTNLPGGAAPPCKGGAATASDGYFRQGEVVVPYVAPLPTEDAGTTRHLCLLFKQTGKIEKVTPITAKDEQEDFGLDVRSQFRLHDRSRLALASSKGLPPCFRSIVEVERSIPSDPSAATFFTTKWDIQVQEYYEKVGLPEPAAPVDAEIEALLEFHAMRPEELRVRSRHRPDGSVNVGDDPQFWGQSMPTRIMDGSMQKGSGWSRRTAMGKNGAPVVYPH